VSNKTFCLFSSSSKTIISPKVNSSFVLFRFRSKSRRKEDAKGALTLSSGDKGPILGPYGILTRQWEQTPGEKYPGLRTDGIFRRGERRGVDTPKGIETSVSAMRIARGKKRGRGKWEESAESGDATRLQVRRESNFPRQILKCAPEPGCKARAGISRNELSSSIRDNDL